MSKHRSKLGAAKLFPSNGIGVSIITLLATGCVASANNQHNESVVNSVGSGLYNFSNLINYSVS